MQDEYCGFVVQICVDSHSNAKFNEETEHYVSLLSSIFDKEWTDKAMPYKMTVFYESDLVTETLYCDSTTIVAQNSGIGP